MKVCIHRGTREIGGTCIEVESAGLRLVLDVGLPLNTDRDVDAKSLLPDVKGFANPDDTLLAALISHPHQDHFGLAQFLPPQLPVIIGEAAHNILRSATFFTPSGADFKKTIYLKDQETIKVGPFEIIPFLVDHSAYDAYDLPR